VSGMDSKSKSEVTPKLSSLISLLFSTTGEFTSSISSDPLSTCFVLDSQEVKLIKTTRDKSDIFCKYVILLNLFKLRIFLSSLQYKYFQSIDKNKYLKTVIYKSCHFQLLELIC